MTKGRLEAFSDGVIAILITIMVLDLKVPHAADLAALRDLVPVFLSYVLSYIFLGIYWNNHHHLLHAAGKVNGRVMWANLILLFWLSLIPFATSWLGENHFAATPAALYGIILLAAGLSFTWLGRSIVQADGAESKLLKAVGLDRKGKISTLLYALAIPLAFVDVRIAYAIYVGVACLWVVPDRRIEAVLTA